MRFFAIFLIFALVLAVAAAPKNNPKFDPKAIQDFLNEFPGGTKKERRTFDDALVAWLKGTNIDKKVKRGTFEEELTKWLTGSKMVRFDPEMFGWARCDLDRG
jgi:hypothetical protein